jgi:hypothetical protein
MFTRADLSGANLADSDCTKSSFVDCMLHEAHLEDAILARVDFRDADLSGSLLFQAVFSETRLNERTIFSAPTPYESGTASNSSGEIEQLAAAAWVYRQLERIHEENALSDAAREFHIRRAESQRRLNAKNGRWSRYLVSSLNNILTRHGESPWRVITVSIILVMLFSPLYLIDGLMIDGGTQLVNGSTLMSEPLRAVGTVLYFSSVNFVTLGTTEVNPVGFSRAIAIVEATLGVLTLSLLVFVLGRQTNR